MAILGEVFDRVLTGAWVGVVLLIAGLLVTLTMPPSITSALNVVLGSTISAGVALLGVRLTMRNQARRATYDRTRLAYRQLGLASNHLLVAVTKLEEIVTTRFPNGSGLGRWGDDLSAEAYLSAKEANTLMVEASVALALESEPDAEVQTAYEQVEQAYWDFISAYRLPDLQLASKARECLQERIGVLMAAARHHLIGL